MKRLPIIAFIACISLSRFAHGVIQRSVFEETLDASLVETSRQLVDGAFHVSEYDRIDNAALLLKLQSTRSLFMHDALRVRRSLINHYSKTNYKGFATIDPLFADTLGALSIGFSDLPLPQSINQQQAALLGRRYNDLSFTLGLIKTKLGNTFRGRIIVQSLGDMVHTLQKDLRVYKQEVYTVVQVQSRSSVN